MRKTALLTMVGLAAAAATLIPAMSATAAPTCDTGCVVSFTPGAQTTWTVPSDATDVTVVVAGGAGGASVYASTPGGAGGKVTVDLGTSYNGETLHVLAGDKGADIAVEGPGGGGGGSYVADASGFIAVAGGGGGTGALSTPPAAVPGGMGGYASASANGADGASVNGYDISGLGAVGATPGGPTSQVGLVAYGGTGGVASVAGDGTITPGAGGEPALYLNFPVAQGGGGYAGGGGGSAMEGGSSLAAAGAGGGGSGFLRAGLTASAVEPNTGAGSITFTYTMDPSISAPTASVPAGSTASTIIDGVAPSTAFSVLLDGTTVVASGTTPVTGGPVTQSFTVPADTSGGTHTLTLQVGGIRAATSAAFTVTAAIALAATGVSTPWWVAPGVAMLIAVGTLLLWWTSRRSRARLVR